MLCRLVCTPVAWVDARAAHACSFLDAPALTQTLLKRRLLALGRDPTRRIAVPVLSMLAPLILLHVICHKDARRCQLQLAEAESRPVHCDLSRQA